MIFPQQLSQSLFEFYSQPSHIFRQYLVDIVTTHIGTWWQTLLLASFCSLPWVSLFFSRHDRSPLCTPVPSPLFPTPSSFEMHQSLWCCFLLLLLGGAAFFLLFWGGAAGSSRPYWVVLFGVCSFVCWCCLPLPPLGGTYSLLSPCGNPFGFFVYES